MTVTLHLEANVEARLLAEARAHGMDVGRYVEALVEHEVKQAAERKGGAADMDREEAVRRMLEFGDKHRLEFGRPITREALHQDHRF